MKKSFIKIPFDWVNRFYPNEFKRLNCHSLTFNEHAVKLILEKKSGKFNHIPNLDILATIRLAMLESFNDNLNFNEMLNFCRSRVDRLYRDYGFHNNSDLNEDYIENHRYDDSGKPDKKIQKLFYIIDADTNDIDFVNSILDDYQEGMNVKSVCDKYGIKYNKKIQRAFNYHFPRNKKITSKYKGVSFDKSMGKWKAQIYKNERKYFLGYYENEINAANAYINFKNKGEVICSD